MEMIEGAESSVGSPRGTNLVPQSSSINSITGANLLKGVKKTNSNEDIIRFRKAYHGIETENTNDPLIVEDTHFRKRTKPVPEKTGIGYKVFFQKDGKLYPPMVADPNGEDTPVGVWLDADAALYKIIDRFRTNQVDNNQTIHRRCLQSMIYSTGFDVCKNYPCVLALI